MIGSDISEQFIHLIRQRLDLFLPAFYRQRHHDGITVFGNQRIRKLWLRKRIGYGIKLQGLLLSSQLLNTVFNTLCIFGAKPLRLIEHEGYLMQRLSALGS
ncbi:hypothetical protein D3C85_1248980 [compost metagenome]